MKKILVALLMIVTMFSVNVNAEENEFTRFVDNIKSSSFFKDYKDMNENGYETFIESNEDTVAIIGKYNDEVEYILYYEYDEKTGILTYEISDLVSKTNRKNLEKQISAALVWNQYVVEAVGGKTQLANYKTVSACSLTLKDNGIELVTENLGGKNSSEWQGYKVTYDEFYSSMQIDLKNAIEISKGNTVNKVTDFDIVKGGNESNPSTGVTSTLMLVAGVVASAGVIYVSVTKIKKLKEAE